MNPPAATVLEPTALGCVLLLPLLLMHAHCIAEVAIGVTDLCFLLNAALLRDWAWLAICSLPLAALHLGERRHPLRYAGSGTVCFLLVVAAMEHWILRSPAARQWFYRLIAASALWITSNCIIQDIFGRNLIGVLAGPFGTARGGPQMARIIIPAVLPQSPRYPLWPALRPGAGGWRAQPNDRPRVRRLRHRMSAIGKFLSNLRRQPARDGGGAAICWDPSAWRCSVRRHLPGCCHWRAPCPAIRGH